MSLERELARELQAAGFLVASVDDLRHPYEGAIPIPVKYVDQKDLPLGSVVGIASCLWNCPAARGSDACRALLRAYANHQDADPEIRFRIAEGIAKMAAKGELPQILAILRDRSQYVFEDESRGYSPRHALVEAIPRLMGRNSLELWRELLSDPEDRVRASAIAGLCRLQDPASLPRLREAAAEITHVGMRKKVAAALGKLEQTRSS